MNVNVFDDVTVRPESNDRHVKNEPNPLDTIYLKYNTQSKFGYIGFTNGWGMRFFNGYPKKIKMTPDHELNRIRLFLAEKNAGLNNEYYSAAHYVGKTSNYYTVSFHSNGKQKIVAKAPSADYVMTLLNGSKPSNIYDDDHYYCYINYLKNREIIDKSIETSFCSGDEILDARNLILKEFKRVFKDIIFNGEVLRIYVDEPLINISEYLNCNKLEVIKLTEHIEKSEIITLVKMAISEIVGETKVRVKLVYGGDKQKLYYSEHYFYYYGLDIKKLEAQYYQDCLHGEIMVLKDKNDKHYNEANKKYDELKKNIVKRIIQPRSK